MNFGEAIAALKAGKRVCRGPGWNGKGMWLVYVPGSTITVEEGRPLAVGIPVGTVVEFQPYIVMKTAQDTMVPWLASQSDVLGEDWEIVE